MLIHAALILFAVAIASTSYIHIFLPKSSAVEVFGYKNARIFWIAAGTPFAIFLFGVIAFLKINFDNKWINKLFNYSTYSFLLTGAFFSIKPFIPRNDFPIFYYYFFLLLVSAILIAGIVLAVKAYKLYRERKLEDIVRFLWVETWSGVIPRALKTGYLAGHHNDLSRLSDFKEEEQDYKQKLEKVLADV